MSREIKFRVWDIEAKSFIQTISVNEQVAPYLYGDKADLIFQQFMGLKDKNRREIYEGDIVKVFGDTSRVSIISVEYEENCGFLPMRFQASGGGYSFEVIGNVFENKDLLK